MRLAGPARKAGSANPPDTTTDVHDVSQSDWLQLVAQLDKSAIPPRYLAGWPPPPSANAARPSAQRAGP
jgi:hypothetical protein